MFLPRSHLTVLSRLVPSAVTIKIMENLLSLESPFRPLMSISGGGILRGEEMPGGVSTMGLSLSCHLSFYMRFLSGQYLHWSGSNLRPIRPE